MDAQHTPGPWTQLGSHDLSVYGELVEDDRGTSITETIVISNLDQPEMAIVVAGINHPNNWDGDLLEANARLIAAAPDLLAACLKVLPHGVGLGNSNIPDSLVVPIEVTMGELRMIAAAIAKATTA